MTDDEALEASIALLLKGDPPYSYPARVEQVKQMLANPLYGSGGEPRSRKEVGEFASYVCQGMSMRLPPWEDPPCHSDGVGNSPAARYYRKLKDKGESIWHPNPLKVVKGD